MESSRIFVRGLPPKFTEDDVRKHFAKFPVTDVKFFPHRRIGYVGYKTPEDAAKAVKYFNKTFIKLTKIHAEIARPVSLPAATSTVRSRADMLQISDKELPKPRWQQKAERIVPKNDEFIPLREENVLKRKREEAEQDPKLKEFLEAYVPPSKTNMWADADAAIGSAPVAADEPREDVVVPADDSDDDYQVIAKKVKTVEEPRDVSLARAPTPEPISTHKDADDGADKSDVMEGVQDAPVAEQGPVTDDDWLRSRTNRVLDLVEDDEMPSAAAPAPVLAPELPVSKRDLPEPAVEQRKASPPAETQVDPAAPSEEDKIRETGRLYLRNLHFDVTEDDLRTHFSKYGSLEEVRLYNISFCFTRSMMNIKIGTTDALHLRLTWRIF